MAVLHKKFTYWDKLSIKRLRNDVSHFLFVFCGCYLSNSSNFNTWGLNSVVKQTFILIICSYINRSISETEKYIFFAYLHVCFSECKTKLSNSMILVDLDIIGKYCALKSGPSSVRDFLSLLWCCFWRGIQVQYFLSISL